RASLGRDVVSVARNGCARQWRSPHDSSEERNRGAMRRSNEAMLTAEDLGCAQQLARFFPTARRIQLPVQVTSLRGGKARLREATVVEFGGSDHAIFLSTLPLE